MYKYLQINQTNVRDELKLNRPDLGLFKSAKPCKPEITVVI
ncbi:MAG: hypothetical protein RI956_449 [Pseudomonadota bacterium]|jgi:hypothetical protein